MMKKPNCGRSRITRFKKAFLILLAAAAAVGGLQVSAADTAYNGYYYDRFGNACPSPNQYMPKKTVSAKELGIGGFGTVNDLVTDQSGRLYILDSDKRLIYRLDRELNNLNTIRITDGSAVDFSGAQGFTIAENNGVFRFYIADTDHERVLVADETGTLLHIITKPDCDVISDEQSFLPIKVAVDKDDSIYVLCEHIYDGALLLNSKGEFLGFFGSNKVEVNGKLLSDRFWKSILGEKFQDKFARYVPREYTNLMIDDKGFVYTTTLVTSDNAAQIRLLNWKSSNVLASESFGDSDNQYGANKFIDIAVMRNGLFAALDTNRGRIFIYGEDGDPVAVFGGSGFYSGNFRTAVAIEAIEDDIYVYDLSNQSITVFEPTDYGTELISATRLFLQGDYENAKPIWENVLSQNNAYEKAYISIGRYYMEQKDYKKALSYFKQGGSASEYSDAYEQVRNQNTRKWFPLYATVFVAVIIFIMYLLRDKGSYQNDYAAAPQTFSKKLRYALFHPNKGITELVAEHKKMNIATVIILLSAFLISIISYRFTGFIFNQNDPNKMDIVTMFVGIAGIFVIAVAANWLVTTMTDGTGKLPEIANVIAFSLLPVLCSQILNTILSNVLTASESMFLSVISVIGYLWTAVLLVLGLAKIHQFSFSRNLLMLGLTVVEICIILVLLLLCFSITKQIQIFFSSVFDELKTIV